MVEHYWNNLSNGSYGVVILLNYSYSYMCIYDKYDVGVGVAVVYCMADKPPVVGGLSGGTWFWKTLMTQ